MNHYLTESTVENMLNEIVPSIRFIRDRIVPNSLSRCRPDYRSVDLMLIIEFDGYKHYCSSQQIIRDYEKDKCYKNMGYTIFRIPYFIQITNKLIYEIFKNTKAKIEENQIKYNQTYPNGFIDKKATLPADFCELGIERFKHDIERFYYNKKDIIKSLINKINEINNKSLVIPNSLEYLLN